MRRAYVVVFCSQRITGKGFICVEEKNLLKPSQKEPLVRLYYGIAFLLQARIYDKSAFK